MVVFTQKRCFPGVGTVKWREAGKGDMTYALHKSLIPDWFLLHSGLSLHPHMTHLSTPGGGKMSGLDEVEVDVVAETGWWWAGWVGV